MSPRMIHSNVNYKNLHYQSDANSHSKLSYIRLQEYRTLYALYIHRPMSVRLRHRLDTAHEKHGAFRDHSTSSHEVTTTGKHKTYIPTRVPMLMETTNAYPQVVYKPETLEPNDIQCIVGAKVIRLPNNKEQYNGFQGGGDYYHLRGYIGIEAQMAQNVRGWELFAGREVLSVVYISRKDGLINHDIYYTWCKETGLPFPEQLKHTSLNNDCSNTYKVLNLQIKNKHNYLSVIDSIRNKKVYTWQVPYDNKDKEATKIFSRPSKSRYDRHWQIDSYKKRRLRRLRREENRHK